MALNPPPTIELGLGLVVQPLQLLGQSRTAEVTFALNVAGVPSVAVAQTAINHFQTDFSGSFVTVFGADVTMGLPSIKLGDGSAVPFEALGQGPSVVGGNIGALAPPNVALLVKKRAGLGGRQNRGRSYFPFVITDAELSETGTLSGVTVTAFNVLLDTFLNDLITHSIPMVIAHKTFSAPLPPRHVVAVHTGPLVTSYTAEALIGTQRRRLGR